MKKEIAEKLAAKLESGKYPQGWGFLLRSGAYCCLGVLCELYREETGQGTWRPDAYTRPHIQSFVVGQEVTNSVLPDSVKDWAGMSSVVGGVLIEDRLGTLAILNDDGVTFSEIAKIIREKWELI